LIYPAYAGEMFARPGASGLSYLAAHGSLAVALALAFAVFFVIYASLERAGRMGRGAWPGRLHAGATLLGAALMFAPAIPVQSAGASAMLDRAASNGYLLTLLAQALFVLVLLDAFRRPADLR
jgi:hypothetical protein